VADSLGSSRGSANRRSFPDVERAMMRLCVVVAAVLALTGASGATADPRPGLRVLFVGNSLTASNDLPAEVARLAAAGGRRIEYRAVVWAGFNLEDHWNVGEARSALATRNFDVVVMQQGPSALLESQIDLQLWAKRWADEARAVGTRTACGRSGRSRGARVRCLTSSVPTAQPRRSPTRKSIRRARAGPTRGSADPR
jgi:hypothetical protein